MPSSSAEQSSGQAGSLVDLEAINAAMNHNDVVSDEVVALARMIALHEARQQSVLDEEIARTQSLLDSLKAKHLNRAIHINNIRSTFAPHRKLPNELLSVIFRYCTTDPIGIPWGIKQSPFNLTHVCSRWRHVALSVASLWTNIVISTNIHYLRSLHKVTEMANEVFSRRRTSLISLDLHVWGHGQRDLTDYFVDLLASNANSVGELCLRGEQVLLQRFLALPPGLMDSLHSLRVDGKGRYFSPFSVVEGSRNLRTFFCGRVIAPKPVFQLPLSQLTHLYLPFTAWSTNTVVAMLSQCNTLVDCQIGYRYLYDDDRAEYRPSMSFHVPALKKLVMMDYDPYDLGSIQLLVLPKLVDFEFRVPPGHLQTASMFVPLLTAVIANSSCLQTLFWDMYVLPEQMETMLEAMPSIIRLDMRRGAMLSSPILKKMSSGDLVPKLSSLSCVLETVDGLVPLLDMLEDRRSCLNHAAPIEEASLFDMLDFYHDQRTLPVDLLREFVKKGHNIKFPWT
ncbi:hypothetical protein Hypma_005285 [Hypsizygus marmoreus]|uniref:F-box domain-containing protein n=1 Tax=Hypsizygus marmoreus TaxID=39966 RepID=A0A369JZN0_HYPMA|nr:hypothetical protein Hypma_005285 [Hypsizygus marmoreus]